MDVPENTEAILSDDYEEGEILDEDTLYDNVSSLEEFSGSDNELKSHGEVSSTIIKKSISSSHKEKHHRRKEHKCKDDSICRKERTGKHCYARIRKSKTVVDIIEKGKSTDSLINSGYDLQNSKKKSHVILSPIHDTITKHNPRHLSVQKDSHEKENRVNHKHSRYYDSHKSVLYRVDKKKNYEKAKRRFNAGNSRFHENRKRSRSPSPKLALRTQIKELAAPRGKSSLLKRLVGSGSIGVKTPKDIEEPKKIGTASTDDNANEESSKDTEEEECQLVIDESLEANQKSDNSVKHQDFDDGLKLETFAECSITISDKSFTDCQSKEIESNPNSKFIESKEINQDQDSRSNNASGPLEKSLIIHLENKDANSETVKELEERMEHDSEGETTANTVLGNSSQNEKNEQKLEEDIDELNLRLEALRTAMLRKHKERKKRGFTCRKKSTLEDDSFAEYVLSHIDKDYSLIINDELHNETSQTDSNGVNILGDLLNPEDMVIDKNDKGDDEDNILENFPYPPNYPMQNSNVPIHYVDFAGAYSMYPYPLINGNIPFPPLKENTNLVSGPDRNIPCDFQGFPFLNQMMVPPLVSDTSQIPLPEGRAPFPRNEFHEAVEEHTNDKNSLENCLKEINTNNEPFVERNKSVRRLSARNRLCRRRELQGKKWHTSRAVIKRKLERREYAEQKRRRKESFRDLKIIKTEGEISNEFNIEESDEEIALRELALKSVKDREKPKTLESISIQQIDKSENTACNANLDENKILGDLHIDIDPNFNSKPLVSYESEGTPTNLSSEPWDDIDEDILRAQLLSSLSSRIPEKSIENAVTLGSKYTKKQVKALRRAERKCLDARSDKKVKLTSLKVNKENFKRLTKNITNDIAKRKMQVMLQNMNYFKKIPTKLSQSIGQSNTDVPIVPKFIISLNDDSSSEDEAPIPEETEQHDVVKSIDLFLQEARIENDLKQGMLVQNEIENNSSKPDASKQSVEVDKIETNEKKRGGGSTPQVLKHLPAWQQEEYRRLKKQIAEKEKVLKAAKEKVLPVESKDSTLPTNFNNKNLSVDEKDSCSKNTETVNTSSENESESVKALVNDVCTTISIEEAVNNLKSKQTQNLTNDGKIVDEVNHLAKIVAQLEKGMGDYRTLKEDIVRKKRDILIAKLNMAKHKKMLFEIRKKIATEEKIIQTKLEQDLLNPDVTKTEPSDKKKPASRDLELCRLRMREFSLRTKMIFDEIDHSSGLNKSMKLNQKGEIISMNKSNNAMTKSTLQSTPNTKRIYKAPITRQKNLLDIMDKVKRNNNNIQGRGKSNVKSLSVSGKQTENWDPFVPICPFDLSGVCKDEECKFQHLKTA